MRNTSDPLATSEDSNRPHRLVPSDSLESDRDQSLDGVDGPARGNETGTGAMTTANKISIFRILLIPVFIVELLYYVDNGREWHRYAALAAFLGAAISDWIDGYIARRFNQRTELGAILDPIADKLLLVSGVVLLSFHHETYLPRLPLWLPVTVISRDLIILAGMIVIHHACGKTAVRAHWIGKVATVLQMAAVVWALCKWDAQWLFGWSLVAAVCTGASGVIYVMSGVRQLSASPASAPIRKE